MAKEIKSVRIIYYSGTGNTRKTASCLEDCFRKKGVGVNTYSVSEAEASKELTEDLLLVVYAVYALNAPEAVARCLEKLPRQDGKSAAVISSSGGGEISPNTACRRGCIRQLERKGFSVFYEEMLVMPSNCVVATHEALAVRLLEILPVKAEKMVSEILSGTRKRKNPLLIDSFLSVLFKLGWIGARQFGRRIRCGGNCSGCGWCGRNCPAGNIRMEGGRPVFGNSCHLCLNCLYGCPNKALTPGLAKFIIIKQGYSLKDLERKIPLTGPVNVEVLAKGYLWSGVKKYLLEEKQRK